MQPGHVSCAVTGDVGRGAAQGTGTGGGPFSLGEDRGVGQSSALADQQRTKSQPIPRPRAADTSDSPRHLEPPSGSLSARRGVAMASTRAEPVDSEARLYGALGQRQRRHLLSTAGALQGALTLTAPPADRRVGSPEVRLYGPPSSPHAGGGGASSSSWPAVDWPHPRGLSIDINSDSVADVPTKLRRSIEDFRPSVATLRGGRQSSGERGNDGGAQRRPPAPVRRAPADLRWLCFHPTVHEQSRLR